MLALIVAGLLVIPVVGVAAAASSTVDLAVTLDDNPDPYVADLHDELVYTSVVTNVGARRASGVVFEHVLPVGIALDYVGSSTTQGTCSTVDDAMTAERRVRCAIGALDPGRRATIAERFAPCSDAGPVSTTVGVRSSEPDHNGSNNQASQTTTLVPTSEVCLAQG